MAHVLLAVRGAEPSPSPTVLGFHLQWLINIRRCRRRQKVYIETVRRRVTFCLTIFFPSFLPILLRPLSHYFV